MLINCQECNMKISDKAIACPHCGCPLEYSKDEIKPKVTKKSKRKMKLPNGFGQITEIKNRNLRKPFRVMVTVGKDENGRPIARLLKPEGYFKTYNEAYAALMEYNKKPYDIEEMITLEGLFNKWYEGYSKNERSHSTHKAIRACWGYCNMLYNMKVRDIRIRHIKECIDNASVIHKGKEKPATASVKVRMKSLFNQLFDYALEYEYTDKNYARDFKLSDDLMNERRSSIKNHITFTDEEMNILWENVDKVPYVDTVLIQCYTGWRPQELCTLNIDDIDLDNGFITGGMKTKAGTNRKVPIHPRIYHLVEKKYKLALELGSKYLIPGMARKSEVFVKSELTYRNYLYRFDNIVKILKLNPEHKPHDPRKQFITMAKKSDVNEYAIKYIAGHAIADLTEKIYTDRDISWLKKEIEKIK